MFSQSNLEKIRQLLVASGEISIPVVSGDGQQIKGFTTVFSSAPGKANEKIINLYLNDTSKLKSLIDNMEKLAGELHQHTNNPSCKKASDELFPLIKQLKEFTANLSLSNPDAKESGAPHKSKGLSRNE